MRFLSIIVLVSFARVTVAGGPMTTIIIFPAPQPAPAPKPKPKPLSKGAIMALRRAAKERDEENERVAKAIQEAKFRKWQAEQKVDPDKDQYRKMLAEKQARADADADPDAEQMREFFAEQDCKKNVLYKKWLESRKEPKAEDEFAKWREKNPQAPTQPKIDEEKFGQDLQKALDGIPRKAKTKTKEQKAEDE